MNAKHFEIAFSRGSIQGHDGVDLRFDIRAAGDLVLPTGTIVVCDPAISGDYPAFARRVAPGRYAVVLSIAIIGNDQRVAYAMIRFAEGQVSQWELAVLGAAGPRETTAETEGYGVDSATGCFMDRIVAQRLNEEHERYSRKEVSRWRGFLEQVGRTYVDTWSWANVTFDPETGANLVAFSSGYGDGFYSSYFGFDAAGTLVCLVTDFGVIHVWTAPKNPHKPWWKFWEGR